MLQRTHNLKTRATSTVELGMCWKKYVWLYGIRRLELLEEKNVLNIENKIPLLRKRRLFAWHNVKGKIYLIGKIQLRNNLPIQTENCTHFLDRAVADRFTESLCTYTWNFFHHYGPQSYTVYVLRMDYLLIRDSLWGGGGGVWWGPPKKHSLVKRVARITKI